MPEISVIVPVYNVEKYLYRCLDSIIAQTFTDFELILIDDGSPDNCGTICDEYAEKDNRIHVIHKENGGRSDVKNVGIDWAFANSNSEWLAIIDSDDWLHPDYLKALYYAAVNTNCAVSICGYEETTGKSNAIDEYRLEVLSVDTETFYCEHNVNFIVPWAKLYKKELFIDIRYPVGRLYEDEFTTYKVLFKCKRLSFINCPLYYYYTNMDGIMNSKWTPKKLDVYDALLSQIDFFAMNNFEIAESYVFTNYACYLKVLENKKDILDDYDVVYKKYLRELKRRLRKYRPDIQKCSYAYEYAYPRFAKNYWIMHAFIQKLGRK